MKTDFKRNTTDAIRSLAKRLDVLESRVSKIRERLFPSEWYINSTATTSVIEKREFCFLCKNAIEKLESRTYLEMGSCCFLVHDSCAKEWEKRYEALLNRE